jgi:hypothetical protein
MAFSSPVQQNYPVPPKTDELLFYIQRNHNENTIVYDALFSETGDLNSEKPIDVYWLRYQEDSARKELKWIEEKYAYGIDWERKEGAENEFDMELVADEDRRFTLKLIAPFHAALFTKINGHPSILERLYIEADNSGVWPAVKYIELFGTDATTKKTVYEKYIVND